MEFDMEARAVPLEKIARGQLVIVLSSNVSTLAIRGWRRDPGGAETDCFGLLGPFPDDTTIKTPCVRVAQAMRLDHLVELPNARIVPKVQPASVELGWEGDGVAGRLATVENALYMALASGGAVARINVKTGEILPQFPERSPALAWFFQWSIAVPRLGKFAEVFHFDSVPKRDQ